MKSTQAPPIIYNLFPRLAGGFRRWGAHLERAAAMGFNWVFVNPIQECGYSGSMYAIKDHFRIDSRYLDPGDRLSADAQLKAVLTRAHGLGLRVMLDLVLNHTAFDSVLVGTHPDWYRHDDRGGLVHPGAPDTGTIWGDLAVIDNEHSPDRDSLWRYWENLASFYLSLGFDGFRCDAAYMVPITLWQRVIQRARGENPAAKFFAETLGCDFHKGFDLARAGFDFNFNSSKWWDFREPWALQQYEENRLHGSPSISFPDSHDTVRLAAELNGNVPGLKMRYLFAALFSTGVMMPAGFEYCFQKPLHVVHTRPEDWEPARCDLTQFIGAVNGIKSGIRLFCEESRIDAVPCSNPRVLVLRKTSADGRQRALVVLNTNVRESQAVRIESVRDLLGQSRELREVSVEGGQASVSDVYESRLLPAQIVVLLGEN